MAPEQKILSPKVAIIGGGPAGLSMAARLAGRVDGEVLVVDREAKAGGIPRHADHPGYGIRDRQRFMTGPAYARVLVAEALQAGAQIRTRTCVTGWDDEDTLVATTPDGRVRLRPEVTVFATGARERPRPARMIPGDRAPGVLTTGQLQNLVHLKHMKPGTRAVIVGAELVSWSAALTLQEAGCRPVALISQYPRAESYALFSGPGRLMFRTKVVSQSRVVAVHGRGRVSAVEVEDLVTGQRSRIDCDTVVFTGDWIPDHELLRMAGVAIDPASGAPIVDAAMRTSSAASFRLATSITPWDRGRGLARGAGAAGGARSPARARARSRGGGAAGARSTALDLAQYSSVRWPPAPPGDGWSPGPMNSSPGPR